MGSSMVLGSLAKFVIWYSFTAPVAIPTDVQIVFHEAAIHFLSKQGTHAML